MRDPNYVLIVAQKSNEIGDIELCDMINNNLVETGTALAIKPVTIVALRD